MNYEKLWFELKEEVATAAESREQNPGFQEFNRKLLAAMTRKETSEHRTQEATFVNGEKVNIGVDPEKGEKKKKVPHPELSAPSDKILKDIFGSDYCKTVGEVTNLMAKKGQKVILVDSDLELPEWVLERARERNIALAQVGCEVERVRVPFPFPEFLKI